MLLLFSRPIAPSTCLPIVCQLFILWFFYAAYGYPAWPSLMFWIMTVERTFCTFRYCYSRRWIRLRTLLTYSLLARRFGVFGKIAAVPCLQEPPCYPIPPKVTGICEQALFAGAEEVDHFLVYPKPCFCTKVSHLHRLREWFATHVEIERGKQGGASQRVCVM